VFDEFAFIEGPNA